MRHTPDFFVRRADGTGLVVDVLPDERIGPDDAAKFTVTAASCRSVGWGFVRVGPPETVLMVNVRWPAGYRHPRVLRPEVAARAPLRGTSRTWLSTTTSQLRAVSSAGRP
ncbi:hypothetical protein AB0N81_02665 [Streptomyces sp. NPDC093510]|uniref:hypothetical protein n=1 Tax=Streptomyces sp. NPDC093510 TaxID=3155199 RepID=UPI00343AA3BB